MAGRLPMGQKELLRGKTLEMVRQGRMTLKAAAVTLRVSCRQGIRLYAAYRKEGDAGLIHGNCGKKPNNRLPETVREGAVRAYRERHSDFGPAFAAEKLSEAEGITVSAVTPGNLLTEAGEWRGRRRRKECRSLRERRARFGEPVQFDGSRRKRFEERGSGCCLMTMTDGAANTRAARFSEGGTTAAAMTVFSLRIRGYGIPQALYCGKKNAFAPAREPAGAELLKGTTEPKSRFGRACEKPGVQVITADSPQAAD